MRSEIARDLESAIDAVLRGMRFAVLPCTFLGFASRVAARGRDSWLSPHRNKLLAVSIEGAFHLAPD